MNQENLKYVEINLQNKRNQLGLSLDSLLNDKNQTSAPLTQNLDDQSIQTENNEVIDDLDVFFRKEINQIDSALVRIQNGTFGICLECGAKIKNKRLKALPYTKTCIECAV